MKHASALLSTLILGSLLAACGGADDAAPQTSPAPSPSPAPEAEHPGDHAHDEEPLGTVSIGDLAVELAQGHGAVLAGAEGHLVVKLPYSDDGATIVRAWIGGEDRTLSYVGLGEYASSHDDYDVHATAPDPLPATSRWWIEIEKPDGSKLVGSAVPILE
jgi:hypothetical protein